MHILINHNRRKLPLALSYYPNGSTKAVLYLPEKELILSKESNIFTNYNLLSFEASGYLLYPSTAFRLAVDTDIIKYEIVLKSCSVRKLSSFILSKLDSLEVNLDTLADKAHITKHDLYKILRHDVAPSIAQLLKISKFLKLDYKVLLAILTNQQVFDALSSKSTYNNYLMIGI